MTLTDIERRQLIVQRCHPTPRDPHGLYLDLRLVAGSNGKAFIRACDGGAPDLAASTDSVISTELGKPVDLLRLEQLKREAGQ